MKSWESILKDSNQKVKSFVQHSTIIWKISYNNHNCKFKWIHSTFSPLLYKYINILSTQKPHVTTTLLKMIYLSCFLIKSPEYCWRLNTLTRYVSWTDITFVNGCMSLGKTYNFFAIVTKLFIYLRTGNRKKS